MYTPLYVAKKSAFIALRLWCVLPIIIGIALGAVLGYVLNIPYADIACFAVAGVFFLIQLCIIIHVKTFSIKVYEDRLVVKRGLIFVKEETHGLFVGLVRMHIHQNFWGNLLDYGTFTLQCVGRSDIDEDGIFDPHALKYYLQRRFINVANNTQTLLMN